MKTSTRILLTAFAIIILVMITVGIVLKTKTNNLFVKGDGNIITQEQTLEPFDELIIEGALSVDFILGESNLLYIKADSNLMENVEISLVDKTLKIKNNTYNRNQIACNLTAPMVNGIRISGGVKFSSKDTIQSNDLKFTVNAGAILSLIGNFGTIISSINAGGKATLVGTCKEMKASLSAGSNLQSFEMETDHLIIDASAGANAVVNSKELEASATAGSTIRYNEGAILKNIKTSAGGSILSKTSKESFIKIKNNETSSTYTL